MEAHKGDVAVALENEDEFEEFEVEGGSGVLYDIEIVMNRCLNGVFCG